MENEGEENGTDFPTFRFEPTGLMVMFKGRIPAEEATPTETAASGKRRGNARETVGEILQILQANPKITRKGLSERLQLSIRGVEWNLAKMKQEGLIRRIGPNKGGRWEVIKSGELKKENGE